MRRSDVYVLAVQCGVNPAERSEWTFRVLPTDRVEEVVATQKTITLAVVDARLDPLICAFDGLGAAVAAAARSQGSGPGEEISS